MTLPPALSVIIPSRNRPEALQRLLDALACQQPVPGGFEVLVVDDGSDPPLDQELMAALAGNRVRLLHTPNRGPAEARNLAALQASGHWLVFTDDDCLPEATWLQRLLVRHRESDQPRLIGGRTVNRLRDNPFAATSQNLITIGLKLQSLSGDLPRFFPANNFSVPRQEFLDLDGFDERFRTAEDRDFCDRWLFSGAAMIFAPECLVHHAHEMGLIGFCRQHFAYGRGAFRFHCKRRHRRCGQGIVAWPYYRALLHSILPPHGVHASPPMALALGLAQIANGLGFFWELFSSGPIRTWAAPLGEVALVSAIPASPGGSGRGGLSAPPRIAP